MPTRRGRELPTAAAGGILGTLDRWQRRTPFSLSPGERAGVGGNRRVNRHGGRFPQFAHLSHRIIGAGCAALVWAGALAQDVPADRVSVPFRDPSRPGTVKVHLMTGGITVKGYDGKEVIVEARLRGGKSSGKEKPDKKADGLKRIDIATTGLTVEEEDNVVTVSTGPLSRTVDLTIQVPTATSLKLGCLNDGGILVEKVEGEIEANNLNGSVTLTNVSGVVIAHSLNGEVLTQMDKVTPDKPMSFSTLNGDIDVTLPPDIRAKVKIETQNGAIYSDFEIGLDRNPQPPAVEDGRKEGGRYRIEFPKGVVGSINGGGPEIRFKTLNGNIHVRKGKP